MRTSRSGRGFTLVELLVTVSIVAILAVLLEPAALRAVGAARTAGCLSNLRQLAAGCIAYSGDNNGGLVPIMKSADSYKTWRGYIAPYLSANPGSVFACPADRKSLKTVFTSNGQLPSSYGLNFYETGRSNADQLHDYNAQVWNRKTMAILNATRMIMLTDIGHLKNPTDPVAQWVELPGNGASLGYSRMPSDASGFANDSWDIFPRHAGAKTNVAYYDGHAGTIDIATQILPHPPGDSQCIYDNH